MASTAVGAWHIRPTPAQFEDHEGSGHLRKTWAGPFDTQMYGKGLTDLVERTRGNLNRLSVEIQKTDPCIEYGVKHWHPNARPKSANVRPKKLPSAGTWESLDVIFTDNDALNKPSKDDETDSYVDPPGPTNKFCYLCSTMEEHKRHMLLHKPKKRPKSAKPRITYIAPRPQQKAKVEEDEVLVRERLYKVEVFTSDKANAGTDAKVFISIKGSHEYLPRTQLKKNRGCAKQCFMRASREMFHITGPFLGNLLILTLEHDGTKRSQGWHVDRVEVTDVKYSKTWVFHCHEWLSIYEKPLYSNRLDLTAEEKERALTEYRIEVYTGKQKMAGTDSNIFLTLFGQHGASKKIHLVDKTKKCFEKNSIDNFRIQHFNVGELRRVRIEHDGKGFAAGWFLDKVIIRDSERPKDTYYFLYSGWIAKDEGDGKLWRELKAKKTLPKQIHAAWKKRAERAKREEIAKGTETKYIITVKTGDVRYAGTDADVFICLVGEKGATSKIKLDDAKNNFERNMVDNFEIRAANVGVMEQIRIGHDNSGPGAGWFLDTVTVRRYIPKDEQVDRLKKMKKRLKAQKVTRDQKKKERHSEDDSESDTEEDNYVKQREREEHRRRRKEQKDKKDKKPDKDKRQKKVGSGNLFSVSSESSNSSSSDSSEDDESRSKRTRRPGSALRRQGSSMDRYDDQRDSRLGERRGSRPGSAIGDRRASSASTGRRVSTSASSLRQSSEDRDSRGRKKRSSYDDDEEEDRYGKGKKKSKGSRYDDNEDEDRYGKGKKKSKGSRFDDDERVSEMKVPLNEEYVFVCNRWLATNEDDGLCERELAVKKKQTYFKD